MGGDLRAGTAVIDITPDELTGLNAMGADFEGVHDRLEARALVLSSGGAEIAIVSLDQLEVGSTVELRAEIAERTGIPASHVLIAPTHAHNAPRSGRTPVGGLSRAPRPESLAQTPITYGAIADAIAQAQQALAPARLAIGSGHVDVNVNRNVERDGAWGLGIDQDGPSDDTITVIAVDDADGDALATALVYGVHPTVAIGIRLLSADLAGAAVHAIAERRGGTVLWLAGAIGDQAPRLGRESLSVDGEPPADADVFEAMDAQACAIADEVVRVADGLTEWQDAATLAAEEDLVTVRSHRGTGLPPDMPQHDSDTASVRVIGMRIGDLALAGVGGEVTVPAAEVILAASPAPRTAVVSIANERIGYLADPRAFELGQFAARGCPVQPEWLEATAARLGELLVDPDERR